MPRLFVVVLGLLTATGVAVAAALLQAPAQPSTQPAPAPTPAITPTPPPPPAVPAVPGQPKPDEPKPVKSETRPDGLILDDLVIGTGPEVKEGAAVVAHYRGTLKETGVEFDSSYKRGEPTVFPLKGLIAGWQEGIPGMRIGGKRRLTIPWQKAYGEQVRPGIPPKSDLVFEIEIVDAVITEDVRVGEGELLVLSQSVQPPNVTVKFTGKVVGKAEPTFTSGDAPQEIVFAYLLPGVQFGIDGMKVGGKRKIIFPAMLGWQQKPLPFGNDIHFEFEVELTAVNAAAPTMPPRGQ